MARHSSDDNLQFPPEALYRLGLTQQPFSDPPPSTYEDLTRATQLNVTLSLLQSGERIVLVRGGAGLGKSTFLRRLAERQPPGLQVARLTGGPGLGTAALWSTLAAAAEGGDPGAAPENRDHAANHVRGARRGGMRPALLIDDADRLAPAVVDELLGLWRELDELEEGFALVLAVDPERPAPWGPEQPASLPEERVHTTNLYPLTEEQTGEYLEHRLTAAGAEPGLLTAAEKSAIYEAAGGHPGRTHAEAYRALANRLGPARQGRPGRRRGVP
ncbi:AAA family ATPase, partial [Halorhodospira neutriphila]